MARLPLDDKPPTPVSEYDDIKQSSRNTRSTRHPIQRGTGIASLMPLATHFSAVVAVYPGGRNLVRDFTRASMGCLQHCLSCIACLGGNANTTDSHAPARKAKGKAPAPGSSVLLARVEAAPHAAAPDGPVGPDGTGGTGGTGFRNQAYYLPEAPELVAEWQEYERTHHDATKYKGWPTEEKHAAYVEECRSDFKQLTAPGSSLADLGTGIVCTDLHVPARDGASILVQKYEADHQAQEQEPAVVLVYYHGGGLLIGDADSEQLSFRRFVKGADPPPTLYSVQYRRKTDGRAQVCVDDSIDAYRHIRSLHKDARFVVVGSSSGGELAALVSQDVTRRAAAEGKTAQDAGLCGVLLRCPVLFDSFQYFDEGVPRDLQGLHNSTRTASYRSVLLGALSRTVQRDGLAAMPGEAGAEALAGQPRTWIQACTDSLYSDAVCYKELLDRHGVEVRLEVMLGYPHTFWLIAPQLAGSLKAEADAVAGLDWLLAKE